MIKIFGTKNEWSRIKKKNVMKTDKGLDSVLFSMINKGVIALKIMLSIYGHVRKMIVR